MENLGLQSKDAFEAKRTAGIEAWSVAGTTHPGPESKMCNSPREASQSLSSVGLSSSSMSQMQRLAELSRGEVRGLMLETNSKLDADR